MLIVIDIGEIIADSNIRYLIGEELCYGENLKYQDLIMFL